MDNDGHTHTKLQMPKLPRIIPHQTLQRALGAVHAAEVLSDVRCSGGRCDEKGAQAMSFGDGDLHVQVAQLKTENARLKQQVDKLRALNGELCAEVNAKDKRIRDFEISINDVAEKWAIAQSNYQDSARRNKFLEVLVRDMWEFGESSNYPYTPLESVRWAQMREEYRERIAALGIEVEQ